MLGKVIEIAISSALESVKFCDRFAPKLLLEGCDRMNILRQGVNSLYLNEIGGYVREKFYI
ncbi:hypothetical protein AAG747_14150 [Rapidithrix thailandica]|uniref:Uncharacterized protein n=1 Tax=Rapidithrix thailandica TaxID=413964 RepID=A0AAW9RZ58_9BACT